MRSRFLDQTAGFLVLAGVFVSSGCLPSEPKPPTPAEMVERGRYLVTVAGCNDCHTPKVFAGGGMSPDDTKLLSGHPQGLEVPAYNPDLVAPGQWLLFNQHLTAAVGPWGVSFAANLTPDEDTGLGDWTEEEFIATMRTGTHRGIGRPILPPMPWFNLAQATDQDLQAIFAYLQSIPAISNQVPDPIDPPAVEPPT
jgi:mono/diheme cytochrome c family protein